MSALLLSINDNVVYHYILITKKKRPSSHLAFQFKNTKQGTSSEFDNQIPSSSILFEALHSRIPLGNDTTALFCLSVVDSS